MNNESGDSRLYIKCLNYLCNNLDQFCELKTQPASHTQQKPTINDSKNQKLKNEHSTTKQYLEFKDKLIKFNHTITEDLLERLSDLGKLNDLTITLFNNRQTCLKKVCIKNVSLSKDAIKCLLKQHQLAEILINNLQVNTKETDLSGTNLASLNHGLNNAPNSNANNTSSSSININDLIDGLNDWSSSNLKILNVSRNASLFSSILINFKQLKSLNKLNVSYTCFNNHSLDIITQDLAGLEFLDLSGTRVSDLAPLLRLKDKLKYLYMYNMRAAFNNDIVGVVCGLRKIQHLDLSCDVSTKIFADMTFSLFNVNLLLDELTKAKLNDLKYLDISGKIEIDNNSLVQFIHSYSSLKFIGLALTNVNSLDIFQKPSAPTSPTLLHISSSSSSITSLTKNPAQYTQNFNAAKFLQLKQQNTFETARKNDLIVTGESTESQLIASLKHYKPRHVYIQKALYHLFLITKNFQETRCDILELIIELMHMHNKSQSVQLAATTCIYNLTRQDLYIKIPKSFLTQIINTVEKKNELNCFNPIVKQLLLFKLQKNCLLMLCNEKLINTCPFNKLECIKATLDCITIYSNDQAVINSSIALCAQVLLCIDVKYRTQFKKIAEVKYAQRLVSILNSEIQSPSNELTLYSTLDILISFSENQPEWCLNLLCQNILDVCCYLIEIYGQENSAMFKTLNLIYNFSEIDKTRPYLFCHPIVKIIKNSLNCIDPKISFISVGFLVNLLAYLDGREQNWQNSILNSMDKDAFCQELEEIISNWDSEVQTEQIIHHHSFETFLRLLNSSNEPVVQIWSLLNIENMCQFNSELRYSILSDLNESVLVKKLRQLKNYNETNEKVRKLCTSLLLNLKNPV